MPQVESISAEKGHLHMSHRMAQFCRDYLDHSA